MFFCTLQTTQWEKPTPVPGAPSTEATVEQAPAERVRQYSSHERRTTNEAMRVSPPLMQAQSHSIPSGMCAQSMKWIGV